MNEIFKDIPWYEWLYQASNLGNIKSLFREEEINSNLRWKYIRIRKEKLLILRIDSKKYPAVWLCKDWKSITSRVSRLIASTFLWLDRNDSKMYVCHKDDNPTNNCIDNLFLWTASDNTQDMIKKWRWVDNKWENHWMSKLNDEIVWVIKTLIIMWAELNAIATKFNIDKSMISLIKTWKRWSHITLF